MPRFRKLRAPDGADEVNHGTERFKVGPDHMVEVPNEAVEPLVHVGGFIDEGEKVEIPNTLVPLRHPEGSACSWGGQTYEHKNGVVFVPCAAVVDLLDHGFEAVEGHVEAEKPLKLRVPKSGE